MSSGYVSRSARILFGDRSWWWKVLVLAAVGVVPIIGAIFQLGYRMVFMRQVAWGQQRGLPMLDDVGGTLKTGLNGFVVTFVWGLVLVPFVLVAIFALFFSLLPATLQSGAAASPPGIPWWFTPALALPAIVVNIWSMVAVLRTAIYTTTAAGLSLSQVIALTRRERSGFLRATGVMVTVACLSLLLGLPGQYLARSITLAPYLRTLVVYGSAFLVSLLVMPASLISSCSYGLWAQDTDPSSWPPLSAPRVESAA